MTSNISFMVSIFLTHNGHVFIGANKDRDFRLNKVEFGGLGNIRKFQNLHSEVSNNMSFNSPANVRIDIPVSLVLKLTLYSSLRQELKKLINYHIKDGFNYNCLGSVYPLGSNFCRITTAKISDTKKMIFLL